MLASTINHLITMIIHPDTVLFVMLVATFLVGFRLFLKAKSKKFSLKFFISVCLMLIPAYVSYVAIVEA